MNLFDVVVLENEADIRPECTLLHDFSDQVTYPNVSELFVRDGDGHHASTSSKTKPAVSRMLEVMRHRDSLSLLSPHGQQDDDAVTFFFDQVPPASVVTLSNRVRKLHDLCPQRRVTCVVRKAHHARRGGGSFSSPEEDAALEEEDAALEEEDAALLPGQLNKAYLEWGRTFVANLTSANARWNARAAPKLLQCVALCARLEGRMQDTMTWDDIPLLSAFSDQLSRVAALPSGARRPSYPGNSVRKLRGGQHRSMDDMLLDVFAHEPPMR